MLNQNESASPFYTLTATSSPAQTMKHRLINFLIEVVSATHEHIQVEGTVMPKLLRKVQAHEIAKHNESIEDITPIQPCE